MTGFGTTSAMADTAAGRIREDADAQYQRIRNDPMLSLPGRQAAIGQAYLAAKTKMTDLQATSTGQSETNRQRLMTAAFGIPNDPASAMSYRDACDRADALDSPLAALDLYNRADDTGDHLLAQALARHAYDLTAQRGIGASDPAWSGILDAYCRSRPAAGQAIAGLAAISSAKLTVANLWEFILPCPAEVAGFSDYQIQQLVDQPAGTAS